MIEYFSECTGCAACVNICPRKCINMGKKQYGFKYPEIITNQCIQCGLCEKVCPITNEIGYDKGASKIKYYAAINPNNTIRLRSSSGGAFYSLAKKVLEDYHGVVFGAMFDSSFKVIHGYIENYSELYKFMGSKYVQSEIGTCYQKAKEFLDSGRIVYFSGTPCQIAGLKAYLGKDWKTDKLIAQDIICHGVPSPDIWASYLKERTVSGKRISKVEFRAKDNGWKASNFKITYQDKSVYSKYNGEDEYMVPFLVNLNLRKSCYACKYKTLERDADITLADFWGIDNIDSEFDDDKGVSLVLTHSQKGETILHETNLLLKEKRKKEAINADNNMSAITSAEYTKRAKMYMKDVYRNGVIKTFNYYFNSTFLQKIHRKCRELLLE